MKKAIKYEWFSSYNLIILLGVVLVASGLTTGAYLLDDAIVVKNSFFVWLNAQNEMVAGAFSLWALGVGSYLLRSIPTRIWNAFIKQTTVIMTLNNEDEVYYNFLDWYHSTGRSKKARTLIARNQYNEYSIHGDFEESSPITVSAGYGTHYFMYGGKIFQFHRNEKEASNTTSVKESITLTTIGRTQSQFHQLLTEITPEEDTDNLTKVHRWKPVNERWQVFKSQAARVFDSVILPTVLKNEIVTHIETFINRREWYIERGIPYRTGIILHGMPGTGKTSFVKALCDKFNKDLHVVSLNGLTDNSFEEALTSLPRNAIVLVEDIDTYSIAKSREAKTTDSKGSNELSVDLGILTLSGVLNAIDGIMGSDGRIIIATTNHLEKLDSALIRKGRFNLTIELGYLTDECVREFLTRFYPEADIALKKFRTNIVPADMQAKIMDNIEDAESVIEWAK